MFSQSFLSLGNQEAWTSMLLGCIFQSGRCFPRCWLLDLAVLLNSKAMKYHGIIWNLEHEKKLVKLPDTLPNNLCSVSELNNLFFDHNICSRGFFDQINYSDGGWYGFKKNGNCGHFANFCSSKSDFVCPDTCEQYRTTMKNLDSLWFASPACRGTQS